MYTPRTPPSQPQELPRFLFDELRRVAASFDNIDVPFIRLQELHAAPDKLFDGLTVLADGSDWNPGSGQGVYTYFNSTWNKLG